MKLDPADIAAAIAIGLGASLVMDLWGVLLKRAFRIPAPDYCLLGRWLRHMPGAFSHASIAAAAPRTGECAAGWAAHYTTGAAFALAFVALVSPEWLRSPTLLPALGFGLVTVVFPLFIMQPAFGLGLAASKAPAPMKARLRSLMNHAAFGAGLYVSALAMSFLHRS